MARTAEKEQEVEDTAPARVAIGSEEHKRLFCSLLLDTFDPYRPAVIPWPQLAPDALDRLKNLGFWDLALETEENAGRRMQALADVTHDPLIHRAIALNAFEERRHKAVLEHMMRHYDIPPKSDVSASPIRASRWAFLRTGYGECFDSFFAFGLFALAERAGLFPPALVQVFEPVIQEEARHNLFFVNWLAYTRANLAVGRRPRFLAERVAALAVQIWKRAGAAKEIDGDNFTRKGGSAIGIDIAPRRFLELCLAENERRLSRYDLRLLRPRIMPAAARVAMRLLRSGGAAR
jgi:hypothetical protein